MTRIPLVQCAGGDATIKDLPDVKLASDGPLELPGGVFDSDKALVVTVAEWDDGPSMERFTSSLRWTG